MTMGAEGTIVCPFDTKKSRNFFLISALVIINGRIFGCYLAHTNYICAPALSLKTVQRYTKSGCFVVLALSDGHWTDYGPSAEGPTLTVSRRRARLDGKPKVRNIVAG